jgi:hypothetical protein
VLAVLATWRITHLLAAEDGPVDLIVRVRLRLGRSFAGRLMDCFNCLSLWMAAPFAFFVSVRPAEVFVTWLALSGAACLLERVGQRPVVIEELPADPEREGQEKKDVLWRQAGNGSATNYKSAD